MPSSSSRFAQAAEVELLLDHDRHNRGLAGEHVEAARAQFIAQQLGDAQQVQAAFRFLPHDL